MVASSFDRHGVSTGSDSDRVSIHPNDGNGRNHNLVATAPSTDFIPPIRTLRLVRATLRQRDRVLLVDSSPGRL
jgi:hypothetical protein